MKTIPLRVLGEVNYREVLREVTRRPLDPQKGADITEMRASIRVLDAIEAADGTLELEDSDYDHLKAKLNAMAWNVVDKRLVQMIDDVLGAT